jgi:MOSC domain-containing protein YiiM/GNAT superfamily N-acetyltransferase
MADGRVIQVSVSTGGVPKLAVPRAWVGRLGVEGDGHHEVTGHGGPLRAVCLFAVEAIERVQGEGHPLEPGGAGENLTTSGVEWSSLPIGTRARIGDTLVLELTGAAMPCDTQRPNFRGGQVNRISIKLHPSDSRMYARVLAEGEVATDAPIELLPPDPASDAPRLERLTRVEKVTARGFVALWRAAQAAGYDVRILDDGELTMAASPDLSNPLYNDVVTGMRTLPHLLPRVLDHYRAAGVPGLVEYEGAPWPGAQADEPRAVLAGDAESVVASAPSEGVTVRAMGPEEWPIIGQLMGDAGRRIVPHLADAPGFTGFVAEIDGRVVGTGSLVTHKKVGSLVMGIVAPEARGRGIQRALIAARVAAACDEGCDLIAAEAEPDTTSERNLLRMGLERLRVATTWRFDPAESPSPDGIATTG